jgi:hypothetical protein
MQRGAILVILLSTPLAAVLAASDWPQFLGPSRTGAYVGAPLNEKWPSTGPRVIWRKQVGQGLSGPVVAGTQLILFHRVDDREVVESFDALTGAPKWRHAYQTNYRDDFGFDEGPRAVPWSPMESYIPMALRGSFPLSIFRPGNCCGTSTRCGSSRSTRDFLVRRDRP